MFDIKKLAFRNFIVNIKKFHLNIRQKIIFKVSKKYIN